MTCGIYKITNVENGKYYIGQSVNMERRWREHRARSFMENSNQYNCHFYKAMRKYSNWLYQILEECPKEELDKEEKF